MLKNWPTEARLYQIFAMIKKQSDAHPGGNNNLKQTSKIQILSWRLLEKKYSRAVLSLRMCWGTLDIRKVGFRVAASYGSMEKT